MMAPRKRRTVAHLVWSLDVGGLERVVIDLIRGLDRDRYESLVIAMARPGELADEVRGRCRAIHVLGKKPGRAWFLPLRLSQLLRHERVDILHAHNFGPLLYGAVAARLAGTPAVAYTLHGPEASERTDLGRVDRLRRIDGIVAVSEHVARLTVEHGRIDAERVRVIYNGIRMRDDVDDAGVRSRVRASLGLGPDDVVVGSVSRLSREKDHATLLDGFARIVAARGNARLLLAGDGELRGDLEAQARSLGIADAVMFLGTRHDVAELLTAFDLFVQPSRIEGLGITIIEAMGAGLPVVATAVGGIPEVVSDDTGLLVERGDCDALAQAIGWMLDHPAEGRAMGEAGRARARAMFSVDAMVREYETLYDSVAGGGDDAQSNTS